MKLIYFKYFETYLSDFRKLLYCKLLAGTTSSEEVENIPMSISCQIAQSFHFYLHYMNFSYPCLQ